MRATEIPQNEWGTFFQSFVLTHRGRLCSLALFAPDRTETTRLQPMMLAGLGAEADRDDPRIRVVLADWYGTALAHVIDEPHHGLARVAALDPAAARRPHLRHAHWTPVGVRRRRR